MKMTKGKEFSFAVIGLLLVLSGCGESNTWNQKTTVSVDTPTGAVSGASVVQVSSTFGTQWPSGNEVSYGLKGEAVVLDVKNNKYLFALLEGDREPERFFRTLFSSYSDRGEKLNRIARMQGESSVLETGNYPPLVTFDDIDDPTSVREVDPNNLSATFGKGYSLKSITLEITDEPVTSGKVEKVLGWLASLNGGYLHGGFTSKGAPLGLDGTAFLTGIR